jgi:hypothetical protein
LSPRQSTPLAFALVAAAGCRRRRALRRRRGGEAGVVTLDGADATPPPADDPTVEQPSANDDEFDAWLRQGSHSKHSQIWPAP